MSQNKSLLKEEILNLIVEEKNLYQQYLVLCSKIGVLPDHTATLKHQVKIETLEEILKLV